MAPMLGMVDITRILTDITEVSEDVRVLILNGSKAGIVMVGGDIEGATYYLVTIGSDNRPHMSNLKIEDGNLVDQAGHVKGALRELRGWERIEIHQQEWIEPPYEYEPEP